MGFLLRFRGWDEERESEWGRGGGDGFGGEVGWRGEIVVSIMKLEYVSLSRLE